MDQKFVTERYQYRISSTNCCISNKPSLLMSAVYFNIDGEKSTFV